MTAREDVRLDPKRDRDVALYGYLRGTTLKPGARLHLAGVGDYTAAEVEALPDPCPLPDAAKKRGLSERERLVYAPLSNVGGLLYDRDATYIEIPDWKVQYTEAGVAVTAPAGARLRERIDIRFVATDALSGRAAFAKDHFIAPGDRNAHDH